MRLSFRFRLSLTPDQEALATRYAGCCRFVFNDGVTHGKRLWKEKNIKVARHSMAIRLYELKSKFPWLEEIPTQILNQSMWDLEASMKRAFEGNLEGDIRFPRFKKKYEGNSFRISYGIKVLHARKETVGIIDVPGLGRIRYRGPRVISGRILYASFKEKAGQWHLSLCCQDIPPRTAAGSNTMVGIDRGVASFVALSSGEKFLGPNPDHRLSAQFARLQRSLGRKKRYSNNWKKARLKLARLHIRTVNIRNDFLHKLSTKIVNNHAIVVMERLKVQSMIKSARGTLARPGKGVRRKSGLNRSILDQGWSRFQRMVQYKLELMQGELKLVCPRYTSQTCSNCGDCTFGNRTFQSGFQCSQCGFSADADHNAAINILAAGRVVNACGGMPSRAPLKQETPKPFESI